MRLVDAETVLPTGRLSLEPLRKGHAGPLFPLLRDARIYRFIPQDPPASPAALRERYGRLERRLPPSGDEAWLNWAVRLAASPEYVGRMEATVTPYGKAWIAYELAPAFWGRGYATEACGKVLDLLFSGYRVPEVGARVDTRNRASICLLERLGFERVGHEVVADFFEDERSDEYEYRLGAPASSAASRRGRSGRIE